MLGVAWADLYHIDYTLQLLYSQNMEIQNTNIFIQEIMQVCLLLSLRLEGWEIFAICLCKPQYIYYY